jgi:hypothetical protein
MLKGARDNMDLELRNHRHAMSDCAPIPAGIGATGKQTVEISVSDITANDVRLEGGAAGVGIRQKSVESHKELYPIGVV